MGREREKQQKLTGAFGVGGKWRWGRGKQNYNSF